LRHFEAISTIDLLKPTRRRNALRLLRPTSYEASVSKNVIVDFEKGRSNPTNNNLAAIQRVLEEAGP
jgi:predicted transcriptional regulator